MYFENRLGSGKRIGRELSDKLELINRKSGQLCQKRPSFIEDWNSLTISMSTSHLNRYIYISRVEKEIILLRPHKIATVNLRYVRTKTGLSRKYFYIYQTEIYITNVSNRALMPYLPSTVDTHMNDRRCLQRCMSTHH